MLRHTVEMCPDDLTLLQERLDALAATGGRVVSVAWQPRRVDDTDQSSALDASGSFVVIAEHREGVVLRERPSVVEALDEVGEAGRA